MSTRTQIEFIIKYKRQKDQDTSEDKRTIYQHSDGYPSFTIPNLLKFLEFNQGRNTDIEYLTANFIYHGKKQMEKYLNGKKWNDPEGNSPVKLGFGVCLNDHFHGDIEFLYKVIIDLSDQKDSFNQKDLNIKIECYQVEDIDNKKFKLIHSIQVPDSFKLSKKILEALEN